MDDYDNSAISRAGIEDSDIDSDEADMILAKIHFGDNTQEHLLAQITPESDGSPVAVTNETKPSQSDSQLASRPGTANASSGQADLSHDSDDDSDSDLFSLSEPGLPSDMSGMEVLDAVSASASDAEYTSMMDSIYADRDANSPCDDSDAAPVRSKTSSAKPLWVAARSDSDDDDDYDSNAAASSSSDDSDATQLNVSRGLDNRPVFRDGYLVTTPDSTKKRGDAWCINDKDRMRGLASGRARYYTRKMTCSNCDEDGHGWRNCPKPKKKRPCIKCGSKEHMERFCPDDICFRCMKPGHRARDCTSRTGCRGIYEQCTRCYMNGHTAQFCSDLWRQYHHTTKLYVPLTEGKLKSIKKIYCYNCGRRGHLGHECTKERPQFSSQPPALPFVAIYDNDGDSQRGHRVAHKPKFDKQHERRNGKKMSRSWHEDYSHEQSDRFHSTPKKRKYDTHSDAVDGDGYVADTKHSGSAKKRKADRLSNSAGRGQNKHQWFDESGNAQDEPQSREVFFEEEPEETASPVKKKRSKRKHESHTPPADAKPSAAKKCYNCGQPGHFRYECTKQHPQLRNQPPAQPYDKRQERRNGKKMSHSWHGDYSHEQSDHFNSTPKKRKYDTHSDGVDGDGYVADTKHFGSAKKRKAEKLSNATGRGHNKHQWFDESGNAQDEPQSREVFFEEAQERPATAAKHKKKNKPHKRSDHARQMSNDGVVTLAGKNKSPRGFRVSAKANRILAANQ